MTVTGMRLLVVGASSGIGRAVAEVAAAAGAAVVGAARRSTLLDQVDGLLGTVGGDVRRPEDCSRFVQVAVDTLGGLDALVYAPAYVPLGWLNETDVATWHAVLETNLVGAALVTQAAMPHLRAEHGRVVFLSSDSVARPRPGLVPYIASKSALDALLAGWRAEVDGVGFTRAVIGPTLTDSATASGWEPDKIEEMFGVWQSGSYGRYDVLMVPEQVAEQIVAVLGAPVTVEDIVVQARVTN